jgi:anti-sigma B factor antagonist
VSGYDVQSLRLDTATVVRLTGTLDLTAAPKLREMLIGVVATGPVANLVIDLTQTTFMDSTVIGVLVGAERRQAAADGKFTVVLGSSAVRRALQLTGLLQTWEFADSVEAAVRSD